jgi:hypothetical protein
MEVDDQVQDLAIFLYVNSFLCLLDRKIGGTHRGSELGDQEKNSVTAGSRTLAVQPVYLSCKLNDFNIHRPVVRGVYL